MTGTSCGDLLADKFRQLCFPGKKGQQCKEHGPPTLMSWEMSSTVARMSWAIFTEIATQSQFAPPSLVFAPLLPCPCCLTSVACFTAARICFCRLSSWSSSERFLLLASLCQRTRPIDLAQHRVLPFETSDSATITMTLRRVRK